MSGSDPGTGAVAERVRALVPHLAARAAGVDAGTAGAEDGIDLLAGVGALRWLQPTRLGGLAGPPEEFFDLTSTVATACASTGWLLAALGSNAWHVGLFPEPGQQDVWGRSPGALVTSAVAPVGRAVPAPGGYLVSGDWQHATGAHLAQWALLGVVEVDADGRAVDHLTVLVPTTLLHATEPPPGLGLRGARSDSLRVRDVLVPAHRTVRTWDVSRLRAPGRAANPGPGHAMPWGVMYAWAAMAPVLGAARGALDHVLGEVRADMRLSLGGARLSESTALRARLARAEAEIDAARLQTQRSLGDLWALACRGEPLPTSLRLRARRDQALAVERCVHAVDLLFGGRSGISMRVSGPVERAWRDVHAASIHLVNDTETALAHFGGDALGLRIEDDLH